MSSITALLSLLLGSDKAVQTFALLKFPTVKDATPWNVVLYSHPPTDTNDEDFAPGGSSANTNLATLMGVSEPDALKGTDRSEYGFPCEAYPTCKFDRSKDTARISTADVVIYPWILKSWSDLPNLTNTQTPVLYWREPVPYVPEEGQRIAKIRMGVHFDSEIVSPGMSWSPVGAAACNALAPHIPPAQRKKFALAITGNCHEVARLNYLKKMQELIPLDIYGPCTGNPLTTEEERTVIPEYKFFFGVEHSLECGYTSEKLMRGLPYGVVPVYLGDPCLGEVKDQFSQKPWFVNAREFASRRQLADHLLELNGTEAYDGMLAWMTEGEGIQSSAAAVGCETPNWPPGFGIKARHEAFCQLCDPSFVRSAAKTVPRIRPKPLDFEAELNRISGDYIVEEPGEPRSTQVEAKELVQSLMSSLGALTEEQNVSSESLKADFEHEWEAGVKLQSGLLTEQLELNTTEVHEKDRSSKLHTAFQHADVVRNHLRDRLAAIRKFAKRVGSRAMPESKTPTQADEALPFTKHPLLT